MTPNKIVMHHTVDNGIDYDNYFARQSKGESLSEMGSHAYYHIIVNKDGTYEQHRKITERSRATRENNRSVNIAMVGNFDLVEPTREQIETVKKLIIDIREVYPGLKVYEHGELEGEATSCAGSKFNVGMLAIEKGKAHWEQRVREVAIEKGLDADVVAKVAFCESSFRPHVKSDKSTAGGLFQHLERYRPARAKKYGYEGASRFDGEANLNVSISMLAEGQRSHWNESKHCWGK